MAVGIDLGTRAVRLAFAAAGRAPAPVPEPPAEATPAAVARFGSRAYVGLAAIDIARLDAPDLPVADRVTAGLGTVAKAEELTALVLRKSWRDLRAATDQAPGPVVLAVPADLSAAGHGAAWAAARLAGLTDLSLAPAPVAAAAHCGLSDGARAIVLDLGTVFRVAAVEAGPGGLRVVRTVTDPGAGGDALDRAVREVLDDRAADDPRLARAATDLKQRLADPGCPAVRTAVVLSDRVVERVVTRRRLLALAGPLWARGLDLAGGLVSDLGWLSPDLVCLTGAGWFVPEAVAAAREWAPPGTVRCARPDLAVALGAAGMANGTVRWENPGLPTAPSDLGFAVRDPRSAKVGIDVVIAAGAPRPAAGVRTYYSSRADQTRMTFELVSRDGPGLATVGRAEFALHPPRKNLPVEVAVRWDPDGRVTLFARNLDTGEGREEVIADDYAEAAALQGLAVHDRFPDFA